MRYQTQGVHFHQLPVQQQKWVLLRKNPFFNRWFVPADETPKQAHIPKTAQRKQGLWSRIKNKIKGVFNGW